MKTIKIKSNRTFGVEIEFHGTRPNTLASKIREAGVDCYSEGYNHTTRNHWKIVPDGSCSYELVSPVLQGQAGMDEFVKVCNVLSNSRANVKKDCGVHVHVGTPDATGKKVENLIKYWGVNEHIIDMVVSPSRRGSSNSYCKSIFEGVQTRNTGRYTDNGEDVLESNKLKMYKEVKKIVKRNEGEDIQRTISELSNYIGRNNGGGGRYGKVNLTSFRKYRTIEFRGFNGSTDTEKIGHWINFCTATIDKSFNVKQVKNKVQDDSRLAFAQVFGKNVGRKTLKFMGARAQNFGLLADSQDMFQFATRNGTV